MKNLICSFLMALLFLCANSVNVHAQFNPNNDNVKMLSAGLGLSGWGVPIFARFEIPVADQIEGSFAENLTLGGGLSFQTYGERYFGYRWRHNIFGIHALGNYHFNEILEIDEKWDVYSGLSLGFYIWNTEFDDNSGISLDYDGSGNGGLSLGIQVGGRYFINDKIGINLELGGGTVLSGGNVGATFLF